jgi:hypothetical protein
MPRRHFPPLKPKLLGEFFDSEVITIDRGLCVFDLVDEFAAGDSIIEAEVGGDRFSDFSV